MSTTTADFEYAGRVTATLRVPRPDAEAPPLVFVKSELLGYIPLTLE